MKAKYKHKVTFDDSNHVKLLQITVWCCYCMRVTIDFLVIVCGYRAYARAQFQDLWFLTNCFKLSFALLCCGVLFVFVFFVFVCARLRVSDFS